MSPRSLLIALVLATTSIAAIGMPSARVRAAPNALCPGLCDDGTACGVDTDCLDAGLCDFDETCWPGLTELIHEVLPAYRGGIDDPSEGWVCSGVSCTDDGTRLVVRPNDGRSGEARKTLSLAGGKRYVLRAALDISAEVRVTLELATAAGTLATTTLTGRREGAPVALEFAIPAGSTGRADARLTVTGTGEVAFDGAFLLATEAHGSHLRFTSKDPDAVVNLVGTDVWRYDIDGNPRHHTACAAEYTHDQPCLSLVRFSTRITGGVSPWLDWSELNHGAGSALHRVIVTGDAATSPIGIEIAWRPDASSIIYRGETEAPPEALIFALPESASDAALLLEGSGFAADALTRDLAILPDGDAPASANLVAELPLAAATDADFGALYAELGFELASALGARAFAFDPALPPLAAADLATEPVVWTVDLSDWMDALAANTEAGLHPDWDPESLASRFTEWATAHPALQAALAVPNATVLVDVGPPRFVPWRGPAWRAAFQTWLADHQVDPASVDVASLAELVPLEGTAAADPSSARPLRQEAAEARRWLHAFNFASDSAGDVYRALTNALNDLGVARVEIAFGSPFEAGAAGFGVGPDLYTMAEDGRFGGVTAKYASTEASLCRRWQLGAFTAWLRGHVTPALERAAFTGAPFTLGVRQAPVVGADTRSLAIQLAIAGFTRVVHEGYGPAPFGGPDAFGGGGAASHDALMHVRTVNAQIEEALNELGGETIGRSPIAIFAAQSDMRWVDGPAITSEELGWYTMLSHAGWPVDVLPEDEIGVGLLTRPDQARLVLVLMRRHVSRAAWAIIERWVEDGGHLVVGADLPLFDEAGQLVLARASWFGVDTGSTPSGVSTMTTFQWTTTDGSVTFQSIAPWREIFALSGTVIATADENRPVAVRFGRGRGRVTVSGVGLGEAYMAPMDACVEASTAGDGAATVGGWSSGLKAAGDAVIRAAGLRIDHVVKTPGVQLASVGTTQRPFLALITHDARPANLIFESRDLQRCRGLTDVLGGGDAYINLGSVLASVKGAALFTWDPDSCNVAIVAPRPDKPVDVPPVEVDIVERGCMSASQSNTGSLAWFTLALALLVALGRRRSARR